MKALYCVNLGEEQKDITVESAGDGSYRVTLDGESLELDAQRVGAGEFHILQQDEGHNVLVEGESSEMVVHLDGQAVAVQILDERQAARLAATGFGPARGADGTVAIQAPMPGKVVKCLVREGDSVSSGQGIIIVEAMKMENELRTPVDGTVKKVRVPEGQNVEAGEDLVLIE
jgi:biotin carboxyl carrier protein